MKESFVEKVLMIWNDDTGEHALMLRQKEGEKTVLVPCGRQEGLEIVMTLAGVPFPRPHALSLGVSLLKLLGGTLEEVRLLQSRANEPCEGRLCIRSAEQMLAIPAQASMAVGMALRAGCRILVEENAFCAGAGLEAAGVPTSVLWPFTR